jgi:predicted Fe-S protein YdhL (DUF1289 family)
MDEIARWSAMTASEKWAVLREISAHRKGTERLDG